MKPFIVITLVLLCSPSQAASTWNWSAPAQHHESVVQTVTGAGHGSGCYVYLPASDADSKPVYGILTAGHCVRPGDGNKIKWRDGTITTGWATTDKTGADLAFIVMSHPTIRPVPVSAVAPKVGDKLEFCGYGGPKDVLRHWTGQKSAVLPGSGRSEYNVAVLQGDSGGPIFLSGQLVGVITTGSGKIGQIGTATAFREMQGPSYEVVASFANRLAVRFGKPEPIEPAPEADDGASGGCPGGSCPPSRTPWGGRRQPPRGGITPRDAYPPSTEPAPGPAPLPVPSPVPGPEPTPPGAPDVSGPEFAPPARPSDAPAIPSPLPILQGLRDFVDSHVGDAKATAVPVVRVAATVLGIFAAIVVIVLAVSGAKNWLSNTIERSVQRCAQSSLSSQQSAPSVVQKSPQAPTAPGPTP